MIKKHAVSYTLILTLSVVVVAVSSTFLGLESAWAYSVIKTIPVERPAGVGFNPSNNDMYVANRDSNTVSVIATTTPTPTPTPQQAIQRLINDIQNNPEINDRVKASLIRILEISLRLLNDDNPRNDIAFCILLNSELRIINTYERIRHLDPTTANQLRTQVNTIKNSLDC